MKPHPDMTPTKIIEMMVSEAARQLSRSNEDGTELVPVSAFEQAEELNKIKEAMLNNGVQFQCAGCDDPVSANDAACCECGGFVCPACRAVETEGECDHEPPDFDDDNEGE